MCVCNEFPLLLRQLFSSQIQYLEVLQLKDYWNWELIVDRYKRWLNWDDATMGLMCNAIEYMQHKSIVDFEHSDNIWDCLHSNYFSQCCSINCWGIKLISWSSRSFWNILLVYKFVISYIYSLVCNGICFIPSQTNV